ncbi:hypothetical protein HK104_003072, partial [Borealophlyctis nickersoniae]
MSTEMEVDERAASQIVEQPAANSEATETVKTEIVKPEIVKTELVNVKTELLKTETVAENASAPNAETAASTDTSMPDNVFTQLFKGSKDVKLPSTLKVEGAAAPVVNGSVPASGSASGSATPPKKPVFVDTPANRQMKGKILKQVEFYFSDANLPRDKFLMDIVQNTKGGWVPIQTLTTFNRLKALTTNVDLIAAALKESQYLLEVNWEGDAVRRRLQMRPRGRGVEKTIYAKGFPLDLPNTLDEIESYFAAFGEVIYVQVRRNQEDKTFKTRKMLQGSAYVEFRNITDANNVRQMTLNFRGNPLLIMMKGEYMDMKWREHQAKKAAGGSDAPPVDDDKLGKRTQLPELPYLPKYESQPWTPREPRAPFSSRPSNALLAFEGVGELALMEDVKAFFNKYERVRWVVFKPGDAGGKVLMGEPDAATRVLEKLGSSTNSESDGVADGTVTGKEPDAIANGTVTGKEPDGIANGTVTVNEPDGIANGTVTVNEPDAIANGTVTVNEPDAIANGTVTLNESDAIANGTVTLNEPDGIANGKTIIRKPTEEEEKTFWEDFEASRASYRQKRDNRQGRMNGGNDGRRGGFRGGRG